MWQILNRMAIFPRWPDLKHFNSVTTTHFTDGQSFYDILKVRLMLWQTRFKANEFMVLVHFAVHCGLSSKKLRPGALYTCLPPFQNTCWSAMYDRKSARASSACLASLPKILHRLFTEYLPYSCKTNAWNFSGRWARIWQEFQFFKAACCPPRCGRYTRKRNSR